MLPLGIENLYRLLELEVARFNLSAHEAARAPNGL
jgi:hypothetical protein